jgi:multicomponent Na+:H+ antiporter subunit F
MVEFLKQILTFALYTSLLVHILLMGVVAFRLWKGENVIDRLMASDLIGNLTLVIMVLGTMIHHQNIFLDVALGLAALGFISTIAFAKYITDKRIF